MDFFAKHETSNWFCNVQSHQNDTDKIMDVSPFDDFLDQWTTQSSYQSNKLFLNEFNDLENFNFDFNLPNLDENLEVEQKSTNVVLPEFVHNNEKVESVCETESAFSETSEKVGNELMSFVKKENEWENQDIPFGGNDFPFADSGFSESSEEFGNGFVSFVKKEMKWENQDSPFGENGFSFADSGFVETSANHKNQFLNFVKKENEVENQEFPIPLSLPSNSVIMKKKSSLLQFDEIKEHFDVPITMAAKKLNIGVTLLKRRCRELNINRWPHRKLKSLMLLIDNLKEMGLENEVAMLEKEKKMLEEIPGMEFNAAIKKLRQSVFKANYKKRRSNAFHP